MAKPKIPNQKSKYNALNKRLANYVALVRQIYDVLNLEAAKMAESVKYKDEGKEFHFKDYPELTERVKKLQNTFVSDISAVIYRGTSEEWKNSNLVQDLVADKVLKTYGAKINGQKYKIYYQTNSDALRAFQERKDRGMNLSQKIWNQSINYKTELEYAISSAIQKGTSAVTLSKRISKYLQDFKSLQKDYKEKYGKAVDCHDCEYRSIRLARSEINLAYRTAEQKRWEQMDFVVGQEIKLSNNHTCNGLPFTDICDDLKGRYPKDFKFTGWHPMCRCYVIPVLKTEDEFWAEDNIPSKREVFDLPIQFKTWLKDNTERIEKARIKGTTPYFVKDNKVYTDKRPIQVIVKEIMQDAFSVKKEVQSLAESVASKFKGITTPINLKSYESILRKSSTENISPYRIKDTIRTTIIVEKNLIDDVLKELQLSESFVRLKRQDPEKFMGYSGNIVNIMTSNGLIGEIQVNTAKMIYAKETPLNAKNILGDELWNKIKIEVGIEGGLGHKFYEEARLLDPIIDYEKISEIKEKSMRYYLFFSI